MTLWTAEDAARWPIETKIMVDMALDAGREVKAVCAPTEPGPPGVFTRYEFELAQSRVDHPNGSWIPDLWWSRSWPSDAIGCLEYGETITLNGVTFVPRSMILDPVSVSPGPHDTIIINGEVFSARNFKPGTTYEVVGTHRGTPHLIALSRSDPETNEERLKRQRAQLQAARPRMGLDGRRRK